jgi:hypothetical protein
MAITFHNTPINPSPSDNPLLYVWSSDKTAEANFYFLVKVRVNGLIVTQHKIFPERSDRAHIDISEVVKNYTSAQEVVMSGFNTDSISYSDISVDVSEYYGDPPVAALVLGSSVTVAFKSRLSDFDYIDYSSIYFFSDFPKNDKYYVGYDEALRITSRNVAIDTLTISLYDVNDTLIASDSYTHPLSGRLIRTDLKPSSIVANTTITQANFDSSYYFEVTSDASAESVRYYIDRDCSIYESYRVVFLSRLGNFEAFTFRLVSRLSASTSSKGYDRQFGKWNGNEFQYNREQGREVDYITSSSDRLTLNSDWISESVQNWLMDNLMESPEVYLQDGSNFIRVNVSNKGGERKKRINDSLFNLVIELDYSNTRKSLLV